MTLDEYLTDGAKTAADLARETGLSAASITRIRRGDQNISIDVAQLIVTATGGQVTADDLLRARHGEPNPADLSGSEAIEGGADHAAVNTLRTASQSGGSCPEISHGEPGA